MLFDSVERFICQQQLKAIAPLLLSTPPATRSAAAPTAKPRFATSWNSRNPSPTFEPTDPRVGKPWKPQKHVDYSKEIRQLRSNYTSLLRKTYDHLSAWETVQVARHPQRPLFRDYVEMVCREFRELHGDRQFGDDPAIQCGLARLGGQKVMLIGHHKGRDTKEKVRCSFGLAHPEGYRKALRCMKIAEKYGLPVVTLIDTPGAYPGIGAEERGQAESIARNLLEMSRLRTIIISVVTGEGGSGGALGIGVADRVVMMEFAWYSVISPEACSAILFKDNAPGSAARGQPQAHQQTPPRAGHHRHHHPRTPRRRSPRPPHRRPQPRPIRRQNRPRFETLQAR